MRRWWPSGLLLLLALLGALAADLAPSGSHSGGLWPAGLASAVLVLAGRRAWCYLLLLAPLTLGSHALTGADLDQAVWLSVGICAEATVVWLVLTSGGRVRPRLRTFSDLDRYAAAAVLGAATATTIGFVGAMALSAPQPALVALAIGSSHLSSELVLLPLVLQPLSERATADGWEQALAWVAVLLVTPLVFVADGLPALGFLVMPLLVWGALRLGTWQALGQVLLVTAIAYVAYSLDRGPITWVPAGVGSRADAATVMLQLFTIGCALVVIPLSLMVSLRRTSDREAASERDKLASVVGSARGTAIIGTDERGVVTLFNPGAERLLGYRRSEVVGRRGDMFHSESAIAQKADELGVEHDYQQVARRMVEPDQAGSVVSFRRRDGQERAHLMTLNEIVDERGRVAGYVSTSEDVTEQVRTQEAMERALHRMQEVDALKDAFISTVSHELRTPITSIVGYLELLSDDHFGALSVPQREAVERVVSNSSRLLVLIDDLLTLARMQDTDGPLIEESLVDLVEVVVAGCAVAGPQEGGAVVLHSSTPDNAVWVTGDRDKLEGVVINLIGNAVKFTPEGGDVEVDLVDEGDWARLSVRDRGIGIPDDEIDLLFTRFYRSSVTLERAIPGSGLGLAIAQGVVESHGGQIEVDSQLGAGTTFTVRLPTTTVPG